MKCPIMLKVAASPTRVIGYAKESNDNIDKNTE